MAEYEHGIATSRNSDITTESTSSTRAQVAIGIAPVNLLDDPASAVNVPILVESRGDVKNKLGFSANYKDYSLMQTTLASFMKVGIAPVVMINVLDPSNTRHITAVASAKLTIANGTGTIEEEGVLLNNLVVSNGSTSGKSGTDYIASFDSDGYVAIAVASDGAFKDNTELTVSYSKLNPAGVTAADIVGGLTENGVRTGIELVDEVYSRFGIIPEILTSPGHSADPAVAAALEAKAELCGDLTNAISVVDLESKTTRTLTAAKNAKDSLGCFTRWSVLCWPKVLMGGTEIFASAAVAAIIQYTNSANNGIPASPDNEDAPVDGVVLDGGQEVHFTAQQINDYLNKYGIVSFVYLAGWKVWGNDTAAYPDKTDPNDRYIKCVMVGNYLENRFKTEYLSAVGKDGSYKLIDSVVSNFNADLNALTPNYLAGAEVVFDKNENPYANILSGHFKFHTRYADFTPVVFIENEFTWDSTLHQAAFEGGES